MLQLQLSHEDNANPKENATIQNEQNLKQVPQYKFSFNTLLC